MGNTPGKITDGNDCIKRLDGFYSNCVIQWYLILEDNAKKGILREDFVKDLLSRFSNMPTFLVTAIFSAMDNLKKNIISESRFCMCVVIILAGSPEERLDLTYRIIQNIEVPHEIVKFEEILKFNSLVNVFDEEGAKWSTRYLERVLLSYPESRSSSGISRDLFIRFGVDNPTCPVVTWIEKLSNQIRGACEAYGQIHQVPSVKGEGRVIAPLHLSLGDSSAGCNNSSEFNSNSVFSDPTLQHPPLSSFLPSYLLVPKELHKYRHVQQVPMQLLRAVYGRLNRVCSQRMVTRSQWTREMGKYLTPNLCLALFYELSGNEDQTHLDVSMAALFLLCDAPLCVRVRVSLQIFQRTCIKPKSLSHTELSALLNSAISLVECEHAFDFHKGANGIEEIKRSLSIDSEARKFSVDAFVTQMITFCTTHMASSGANSQSQEILEPSVTANEVVEYLTRFPQDFRILNMHRNYELIEGPTTRAVELEMYLKCYKPYNPNTIKSTEKYYIMNIFWWSKWVSYIRRERVLEIQQPGPIDNRMLLMNDEQRLRSGLTPGKEFIILSMQMWEQLVLWYGGGPEISRTIIHTREHTYELELYPIMIHMCVCLEDGEISAVMEELLCSKIQTVENIKKRMCMIIQVDIKKCRLWHLSEDGDNEVLLSDEQVTIEELNSGEEITLMLETISPQGTFIREQVRKTRGKKKKGMIRALRTETGESESANIVGLENMGNTCYMNSALQSIRCVPQLTQYFVSGAYKRDINYNSVNGAHGKLAEAFGDLISSMSSGRMRVVEPKGFRRVFTEWANDFDGFVQHDSQEFLSTLLDGLNEDLNLVAKKPYRELKDSGNRRDVEVAEDWWQAHTARESSIITALFSGQFKSVAQCCACEYKNAKFEPFSVLQVPLPETEMRVLSLTLSYTDGRGSMLVSVRVPANSNISQIKQELKLLDPQLDLSSEELHLGHVLKGNVVSEYDNRFRLDQNAAHEYAAFVLSPEKHSLGYKELEYHKRHKHVERIRVGMTVPVVVKRSESGEFRTLYSDYLLSRYETMRKSSKSDVLDPIPEGNSNANSSIMNDVSFDGSNTLILNALVRSVESDFIYYVKFPLGEQTDISLQEVQNNEMYMPMVGDPVLVPKFYVKSSQHKPKLYGGKFLGRTTDESKVEYFVQILKDNRVVSLPIECMKRREIEMRKMYFLQRYEAFSEDSFLGCSTPVLAGVPFAVQFVPDFVSGKQLYELVYDHFRRTISNPMGIVTPSVSANQFSKSTRFIRSIFSRDNARASAMFSRQDAMSSGGNVTSGESDRHHQDNAARIEKERFSSSSSDLLPHPYPMVETPIPQSVISEPPSKAIPLVSQMTGSSNFSSLTTSERLSGSSSFSFISNRDSSVTSSSLQNIVLPDILSVNESPINTVQNVGDRSSKSLPENAPKSSGSSSSSQDSERTSNHDAPAKGKQVALYTNNVIPMGEVAMRVNTQGTNEATKVEDNVVTDTPSSPSDYKVVHVRTNNVMVHSREKAVHFKSSSDADSIPSVRPSHNMSSRTTGEPIATKAKFDRCVSSRGPFELSPEVMKPSGMETPTETTEKLIENSELVGHTHHSEVSVEEDSQVEQNGDDRSSSHMVEIAREQRPQAGSEKVESGEAEGEEAEEWLSSVNEIQIIKRSTSELSAFLSLPTPLNSSNIRLSQRNSLPRHPSVPIPVSPKSNLFSAVSSDSFDDVIIAGDHRQTSPTLPSSHGTVLPSVSEVDPSLERNEPMECKQVNQISSGGSQMVETPIKPGHLEDMHQQGPKNEANENSLSALSSSFAAGDKTDSASNAQPSVPSSENEELEKRMEMWRRKFQGLPVAESTMGYPDLPEYELNECTTDEELIDCIGGKYGFVLKIIDHGGYSCNSCHWLEGCTGCVILPNKTNVDYLCCHRKIAIDWTHEYVSRYYSQLIYDTTVTHRSVESVEDSTRRSVMLEECLRKFTETEILHGEQKLRCSNCNMLTNHYVSLDIWRGPPILIIHLKRFLANEDGVNKVDMLVDIPVAGLDLDEFMVSDSPAACEADVWLWDHVLGGKRIKKAQTEVERTESNAAEKESSSSALVSESAEERASEEKESNEVSGSVESPQVNDRPVDSPSCNPSDEFVNGLPLHRSSCHKYDLICVINHRGSMGGGHYTTNCLGRDGRWYVINDSRVMQIAPADIIDRQAYILFYIRQDVKDQHYSSLFRPPCEEEEEYEEEYQEYEDESYGYDGSEGEGGEKDQSSRVGSGGKETEGVSELNNDNENDEDDRKKCVLM